MAKVNPHITWHPWNQEAHCDWPVNSPRVKPGQGKEKLEVAAQRCLDLGYFKRAGKISLTSEPLGYSLVLVALTARKIVLCLEEALYFIVPSC